MVPDPILRLLGLAKKAGRLELGEEPVGAVCRARQAKLVLLAADASPNTRRRAAHFGEAGQVLWLELPFQKAELGFLLGRASCAMLALTDAGFAAAVTQKLAEHDPERYAQAAQQLRGKADRVLQRQKEQRQHEKNLRQGKYKPWAPPPRKAEAKKEEGKGKNSAAQRSRTPKAARRPQEGPPRHGQRQTAPEARPKRTSAKPGPAGRRLTGTFRKP